MVPSASSLKQWPDISHLPMQKPDSNYSAASTWGGVGGFCICLLLAAAGIALFWPVVGYDFIALDDAVYFAENEHVLAGLTWHNLAWAFQSTLDASWYPLSWLSFMLDAEPGLYDERFAFSSSRVLGLIHPPGFDPSPTV